MTWVYLTISLILVQQGYFLLAKKYNITDVPNKRSSHQEVTIRGGGVIFPIAILIWYFTHQEYLFFTIGLISISAISFADDWKSLSPGIRIVVQIMALSFLLMQIGTFYAYWYWIPVAYVLALGWFNAFNFMDGINGMIAMSTIGALLTLIYLNSVNPYMEMDLLLYSLIATLIFAYFNVRRRAKTFAGDVGSISMGFILAFAMFRLITMTSQWEYVLMAVLFGIDPALTVVKRLLKGKNIFATHRTFLFHYLANEVGMTQLSVSALYMALQLVINFVLIFWIIPSSYSTLISIAVIVFLVLAYLLIKRWVERKYVENPIE
ncbi:MAG: glycosyltransferase family 4 protein [Schleiferiaceae bacterium]